MSNLEHNLNELILTKETDAIFVFDGEPSKLNRKYLIKQGCLEILKFDIFLVLFFTIPSILLGIYWTSHAFGFIGLFALFGLLLFAEPLFGKHYSDKIVFTEDMVYFINLHKKTDDIDSRITSKYIEDISFIKIINNGYAIYFRQKVGKSSICFDICQQDLLSKGTIEEFESFFEEYLKK